MNAGTGGGLGRREPAFFLVARPAKMNAGTGGGLGRREPAFFLVTRPAKMNAGTAGGLCRREPAFFLVTRPAKMNAGTADGPGTGGPPAAGQRMPIRPGVPSTVWPITAAAGVP